MSILSVSSAVSYGFVGNSAIQPILNAYGRAVWRIDTVLFSNHPGHGSFRGVVRPAPEVADLLAGVRALTGFSRVQAVMTGYLGDPDNGLAVADAVAAAKTANPNALYLLDPILGDDGQRYVRDGVEEAIADHLLPHADIVTPNPFELGCLTGKSTPPAGEEIVDWALDRAEELLVRGPGLVVVTGLTLEEGWVGLLAVTDDTALLARGPSHPVKVYGAGDGFAALMLAAILEGEALPDALAQAGGAIAALAATVGRTDPKEIDLIGALPEIAEADPLDLRDLWAE